MHCFLCEEKKKVVRTGRGQRNLGHDLGPIWNRNKNKNCEDINWTHHPKKWVGPIEKGLKNCEDKNWTHHPKKWVEPININWTHHPKKWVEPIEKDPRNCEDKNWTHRPKKISGTNRKRNQKFVGEWESDSIKTFYMSRTNKH